MKPDIDTALRHIAECHEEIKRLSVINAELLEALEELVDFAEVSTHNRYHDRSRKAFETARAAIANAQQGEK